MKISELPYNNNSEEIFSLISDEPWSIFLDSGFPSIDTGRYDVIAARPSITLETYNEKTFITTENNRTVSNEDPFELVRQNLGKKEENLNGLPFAGGALGYFAYDLCRRVEKISGNSKQKINMPDMAIGIYDWSVIIDHHTKKTWLASFNRFHSTALIWDELYGLFSRSSDLKEKNYKVKSKIKSNLSKKEYEKAFNSIKKYIRDGDCYQVNFAQHFSAEFEGDTWALYRKLRKYNPAPFSSYMNIPAGSILSSSPERFLQLRGRQVETKPIKGTKHRSVFAYEDKELASILLNSEKDRAENLMIVDLLRNDISKSCESGTVNVPKLFALETFSTVHHLVSTISGHLDHR
ncbi:MAG: anthranilate synthase component I family protein [Gammaproteobacteria bacterium]